MDTFTWGGHRIPGNLNIVKEVFFVGEGRTKWREALRMLRVWKFRYIWRTVGLIITWASNKKGLKTKVEDLFWYPLNTRIR